jgi:hypothetical protein
VFNANFSNILATCISWPEQILPINFINYKNTCMYKTIGLYVQKKKKKKYKAYYLEPMLSIYILVYQLILFKNFKIGSPATFVDKSDKCWTL